MAENSKIQWTTHTLNPWRGCTKVSDGCKNCYADSMSKRNPKTLGVWGANGTRVIASEAIWREPLKWDKAAAAAGERHRVFCASLADVFEGEDTMPAESWPLVQAARRRLFKLIQATPNLDWLLLTKRPENIYPLIYQAIDPFDDPDGEYNICGDPHGLSIAPLSELYPNLWIGTSVENQEQADKRIPELLKINAKVRFLSMEPLLGPVDFRKVPGFNLAGSAGQELLRNFWIIVGGESGSKARPFDIAWARSIIGQCKNARVPVFMKQLGGNLSHEDLSECQRATGKSVHDKKGGDWDEWPHDLRVREFPNG